MENINGKPIDFVVVGAGQIGSRHIDIIRGLPNARLVGVVDIDPSKQEVVEEGIPFFSSIEEYIQSGHKADVATICTPNGLHAPQAFEMVQNQHHVLIEKPMALTRADAEQLLKESNRQERRVFCVLQNRYTPTSQWVKRVVDEDLLGDIFMLQVNCFWNRGRRYYEKASWRGSEDMDGGTLFTQFSHFVDLVHWLFGEWRNIQPMLYNYHHRNLTDFEDSGSIRFNLENGGLGTFNFTTAAWEKNMESSLTLLGEKGTLKVGGQYMDRIEYCHIENYNAPEISPCNPPNQYDGFQGSASNHQQVFNNVLKALHHQPCEITEGHSASGVVGLIEDIYSAAGRTIQPAIKPSFSNGFKVS